MVRPVTDDDIGLRVLREAPAEATQAIDIVAIHGIGAHPDDSWCKNVGTTESPRWVNWLDEKAMLPSVAPQARIMRYGYQSQWFGEGAMRQRASTIARRLLLALKRKRAEYGSRPLIFIAHCFGGLIVLKSLVDARRNEDEWPGIFTSTAGLVFLGTPFRGAEGMSPVEMLEAARREYQEDEVQPEVLRILEPGNEFLQEVVDQFGESRKQANKAQVACFYELKSSNIGKIVGKENRTRFVVSESSGCIDLSDATSKFSLSRTHFDMNKFGNPTEEDFETVRDVIKNMVDAAYELVLARSQPRKSVSRYYHVPPIAVPRFFGRQKLISELHTFLLKPRGQYDKPNVAVLHALGGQGKSQIALELCRRLRKDCRGVFWLDATSKATLERGLEEIADELNRPAVRRLEDTVSKARFVLDTIQEWNEQWLIVYDNYDRPDTFPDIKPFLPESGQGGIICTSRHAATKVLGQQFQVPSMTNDGGIELLLRDMSSEDIENSRAVGEDIVHRLGGLALAIEQAAAYISFNHMSLPDFIKGYERKKSKVLTHMREELWEYQKIRDGSEKNEAFSAFTTWEMSFEQVEQRDEIRKEHITRFLAVAAFLEPSHIGSYLFETYLAEDESPFPWLDIFRRPRSFSDENADSGTDSNTDQASPMRRHEQTSWGREEFWSIVERLHRLSLVQSIEKKPTSFFSLHPVISDWLQLREKRRSSREKVLRETIKLMSVVVGSAFAKAAHASTRQELLAHLDSCQTNWGHMKPTKFLGCADMREETNSFGEFYLTQGKYDRSEELYEALLEEDRTSNHYGRYNNLSQSMANLALTYQRQGRLKEAEKLLVQVIETRKRGFGEEDPGTLAGIHNLASTYRRQGRCNEAEELLVQIIETKKRVLGKEHLETLASIHNLALTHQKQGKWKEAKELFAQVVETTARVHGKQHPDAVRSMKCLASTYRREAAAEEAVSLMKNV